jgi:hypothetical protein
MGAMTFESYCRSKKIKLKKWQRMAALDMLVTMHLHRGPATGKTFLLETLTEFINEHGNDFRLHDGD